MDFGLGQCSMTPGLLDSWTPELLAYGFLPTDSGLGQCSMTPELLNSWPADFGLRILARGNAFFIFPESEAKGSFLVS